MNCPVCSTVLSDIYHYCISCQTYYQLSQISQKDIPEIPMKSEPINFNQASYEFKIKLIPCFNKWNSHPVKADWYDIELSCGAAKMIIPSELFLKFSDEAKKLIEKEER